MIKRLGDCTLSEAIRFENLYCSDCPLNDVPAVRYECTLDCYWSRLADIAGLFDKQIEVLIDEQKEN